MVVLQRDARLFSQTGDDPGPQFCFTGEATRAGGSVRAEQKPVAQVYQRLACVSRALKNQRFDMFMSHSKTCWLLISPAVAKRPDAQAGFQVCQ